MADLINPNPEVFERRPLTRPKKGPDEPLDATDVFEFIRDIQDPEHPYSLEQLNVVQESLVKLDHDKRICTCAAALPPCANCACCSGKGDKGARSCCLRVQRRTGAALTQHLWACRVEFTPTIDHCSLATLIGLCIRTQLMRKLPRTYKIDVSVRACLGLFLPSHLQRRPHESAAPASSCWTRTGYRTCVAVRSEYVCADHRGRACFRGPGE